MYNRAEVSGKIKISQYDGLLKIPWFTVTTE